MLVDSGVVSEGIKRTSRPFFCKPKVQFAEQSDRKEQMKPKIM